MVEFIDQYRTEYGVEPICAVLPISPSTYYARKSVQRAPDRRCTRARRDDELRTGVRRAWVDLTRVSESLVGRKPDKVMVRTRAASARGI